VRLVPVWTAIANQPQAIARLRAAIQTDRVHHAYLFSGASPAAMRDLALAMAAALNCRVQPGEACGRCSDCERIFAGNHPDVVAVPREGAAQLVPIETIRNQVIARVALPPHEARVRVFFFDEATALAGPSANALLKTLEEPPARTMFVLATTAPHQLLPTIRSRCQRVILAPSLGDQGDGAVQDEERTARLSALAQQVVHTDRGDRMALAAQIVQGKGDAPVVASLAAAHAHALALEHARAGEVAEAARLAHAGGMILDWHHALSTHNANPLLALDALLLQLQQEARP
jgi:DNA polymerase III delta' subunit